jgi:micrococcal nuclease
LARWLRGRTRWRRGLAAGAVLLLAMLVVADRGGWLMDPARVRGGEAATYHQQTFHVTRVVDGDTIDVAPLDNHDDVTRVRLWGIDTPEKFRPDPRNPGGYLPADPFAHEASAAAEAWCAGQRVRLHVEPHRLRGDYGRLLAYVELPDGTMLNERLLAAGLATAEERWTHTHIERYLLIQQQAQHESLGLWAD